jgi:hypothetical protein
VYKSKKERDQKETINSPERLAGGGRRGGNEAETKKRRKRRSDRWDRVWLWEELPDVPPGTLEKNKQEKITHAGSASMDTHTH